MAAAADIGSQQPSDGRMAQPQEIISVRSIWGLDGWWSSRSEGRGNSDQATYSVSASAISVVSTHHSIAGAS